MSELSKPRSKYSAPALEKGLDILELLSDEFDGLSVSTMASRLERSVSEIFRMVMVLEERDFIVSKPHSDLYCLSLKMFKLSNKHPPMKRLVSAALPEMEKLANKIEQSCHLVIYVDGKGLVIAQKDGPGTRVYGVRLGSEVPLLNTCSGKLILAYADKDKRAEMLSWLTPRELNAVNFDELETDLTTITEQGCYYRPSPQVQGVFDMCHPVFDSSNELVAVLAIPFLEHLDGSHSIDQKSGLEYLQKSAIDISKALGLAV